MNIDEGATLNSVLAVVKLVATRVAKLTRLLVDSLLALTILYKSITAYC